MFIKIDRVLGDITIKATNVKKVLCWQSCTNNYKQFLEALNELSKNNN